MASRVLTCEWCGLAWEHVHKCGPWPKYCTPECRREKRRSDAHELSSNAQVTCEICGRTFTHDRSRGGQLPKTCSTKCAKQRRGEYDREYAQRNDDHIRRYRKRHYQENKEKVSEYGKRYYEENKDAVNARSRAWAKENRERVKAASSSWYRENIEHVRKYRRIHRQSARAKELGVYVEDVDPEVVADRDGGKCGICGGDVPADAVYPHPLTGTIDHVVPLSKGGLHSYRNVQLAHFSCNSQKGDGRGGEEEIKPIFHAP